MADETQPGPSPETEQADIAAPSAPQDETTGDPSAPENEGDQEPGHPAQPPRGVQKRLNELTREKHEYRRQVEQLLGVVEKIAAQKAETPASRQGAQEGKAPNPDAYPAGRYDPDYIEAMTDYKVGVRIAELRQADMEDKARERQAVKATALEASEAAYAKAHPDYADARDYLLSVPEIASHQGIGEAVMDSDNPAAMLHYLGTHPDEALRIAKLSPVSAARRLGLIEAGLAAAKDKPAKAVSNAPAPARTVSGAGGGGARVYKSSIEASRAGDYEAFRKMRDEEERTRYAR